MPQNIAASRARTVTCADDVAVKAEQRRPMTIHQSERCPCLEQTRYPASERGQLILGEEHSEDRSLIVEETRHKSATGRLETQNPDVVTCEMDSVRIWIGKAEKKISRSPKAGGAKCPLGQ